MVQLMTSMAKKNAEGSGSRKQPGSKRSLGEDRHTHPRLAFHLPEDLRDAIVARAKHERRTLTSVIQLAIENYLRECGQWPPPAASDNQADS